jgi:hypothetical protein
MAAINESMIDMLYNMEKTNKLLKKTPMYKQMIKENKEMKEKIRSLEYAVQYLELKNAKLKKKTYKKPAEVKIERISSNEIVDLTEEDDEDNKIVLIIEECNQPDNNSIHSDDSSFHRFINVVEDEEDDIVLEKEVVLKADEVEVKVDNEEEEEIEAEEELEADEEEEEVEVEEEEVRKRKRLKSK